MSLSLSKPLISICIPAYNNAKFIKSTVQSVIDQSYNNWELIIVDDCSKDNTVEIIKNFTDPRIVLIENERNLGLGGNWNKVIREAKGEFVKLLCGDDIISPDCLEKQVEIFLLNKYPTVSLVTSYRHLINAEGKILMMRKYPFKSGLISSENAIFSNFLFGTNIIGEPVVGLFRKSVLSQAGTYDASNSYLIDLDFWLRVLLLGDLYIIPEPLASFRVSKEAVTSQLKNNQAKLFRQFVKKIYRDKRFKMNTFQYYYSLFTPSVIQLMRHCFMYFYAR